ncbi:VWA domain-containing protein [Thermoflavifilum thermophilum]|uniref:Ca-activated chloride channel family protein n=1 Tax=Thermoflavifilum thermophilum TaxID=1393122 RepID=A0A1I7N9G8_9BACT|nr:VWA domain-containing protein [Thermoflavifilum thermophilum]SFV31312.1 Ca-activated chloride channel family protein [Thermoflavifilum thermophilum]
MLRFQHPEYFQWLLLLIPAVLVFVYVLWWKHQAIRKWGEARLVQQLFTDYRPALFRWKFLLLLLALVLVITGAANLQMSTHMEKVETKGVDVMVALDVSKSMLAQDVQPSRLQRAVQLLSRLFDQLPGDRLGLVVFAGQAYLQMPLTLDHAAAHMYLNSITPDMVPTPGTQIADAIEMCRQAFNTQEKTHKAIILITDGEDFGEGAVEQARKAYQEGIVIYTVGVGTPAGAPIRDPQTGDYKRDENGQIVISRLNETELKQIAAEGHGSFQYLDQVSDVARRLENSINQMGQKTYQENMYTDYNSYFQYFLAIALALIVLELFIPEKSKGLWVKRVSA